MCVCDLCMVLNETQPKISRHLAYLRRVDLVTVRTEGKWKYYAVAKHSGGIQRTLLKCIKSCLRELEELQNDLERFRAIDGSGRCG